MKFNNENNLINLEEIAKDEKKFKTIINNTFAEKELELNLKTEEQETITENNSKHI